MKIIKLVALCIAALGGGWQTALAAETTPNVSFIVTSSGMSLHALGTMVSPTNGGPYKVYLAYAKATETLPTPVCVKEGYANDLDTRFNEMYGGLEPETKYNYTIYALDGEEKVGETSGDFTTGKIYYVNGASGDDTKDGLAETTAVKTPERAVTLAKATNKEGHEIRIASGRYEMSATLYPSTRYALVGMGESAEDVVLDANYTEDQRIVRSDDKQISLANLTFANARMTNFNGYANWTYPGAGVRIGQTGGNGIPGNAYAWVTNCLFTTCTNVNTGAGALFLVGGCKVVDCRFEKNYAGNGANNGCSSGGAVVVKGGGGQTLFERCTFAGNYSEGGEGALSCGSYDSSEASFTNAYGVVLSDCVFTNNAAADWGGVLGGKIVLSKGCTFADNSARCGGIFSGSGSWKTDFEWSMIFRDCVFRGNRAELYGGISAAPWYKTGGPVYGFSNCVFEANYAAKGYSIFCQLGGSATLQDCVFRGNKNDNADYADDPAPNSAAGVCLFGDMRLIQNCVFSNNIGRGSCLVRAFNGKHVMKVEGCTFVANELRPPLESDTEEKWGDNLGTQRQVLFLKGDGSYPVVVMRNTLIANNTNSCGYSCAVYVSAGGTLTNDNVTITGNRCVTSNGIENAYWWNGVGAGIYVQDGGTNVSRNVIITDNRNILNNNKLENFRGTITFINCMEDGATMASTDEVTNYPNSDPQFRDAANGDYTPSRKSPARNKGLLLDWMTADAKDILGNVRVFDGAPDIGAFENVEPIPGMMLIIR